MPRLFSASTPVSPTTAAMAPKAPIGASHMIMARIRKTSFWRCRCREDRVAGPAHGLQREADQQGDQQRLQHRPAVSEDSRVVGISEDEVGGALGGGSAESATRSAPAPRPRGQLQAVARVEDVADDQADGQRHRRHVRK